MRRPDPNLPHLQVIAEALGDLRERRRRTARGGHGHRRDQPHLHKLTPLDRGRGGLSGWIRYWEWNACRISGLRRLRGTGAPAHTRHVTRRTRTPTPTLTPTRR